jgi:hypothetical protein
MEEKRGGGGGGGGGGGCRVLYQASLWRLALSKGAKKHRSG